jgi:hypothetical protein
LLSAVLVRPLVEARWDRLFDFVDARGSSLM